jgi:hypothetical protein
MNGTTLTLCIYWSISFALIGVGFYALNRGYKLILSGRGKSKEESTVELFGLKATVHSIGALVMITAFLWGFAASRTVPSYETNDVRIKALMASLEQKDQKLAEFQSNLFNTKALLATKEVELQSTLSTLDKMQQVHRTGDLDEVRPAAPARLTPTPPPAPPTKTP